MNVRNKGTKAYYAVTYGLLFLGLAGIFVEQSFIRILAWVALLTSVAIPFIVSNGYGAWIDKQDGYNRKENDSSENNSV